MHLHKLYAIYNYTCTNTNTNTNTDSNTYTYTKNKKKKYIYNKNPVVDFMEFWTFLGVFHRLFHGLF